MHKKVRFARHLRPPRGGAVLFLAVLLFTAGDLVRHAVAEAGEGAAFAVRASRVYTGTGPVMEHGCVVVRDGKIVAVGKTPAEAEGLPLFDYGEAFLCPGLIDCFTTLGAGKDVAEITHPMEPGAAMADVIDTRSEAFRRAASCGITTVLVAPAPENVVSGTGAVVKTGGGPAGACLVERNGPVVLSVGPSCLKQDRPPTSRMGALDLLRRTFEAALVSSSQQRSVLPGLLRGECTAFFVAENAVDLRSAAELAQAFHLRLVVVGGLHGDRALDALAAAGIPLAAGPLGFTSDERALRVPGRAERAGIPVAFASRILSKGDPRMLRVTAALAVRHGLSRDAARAGLTVRAAELLGIADRAGTLEAGKDADLAVFTGDPVDLWASPRAVFVNGKRVFDASRTGSDMKGDE